MQAALDANKLNHLTSGEDQTKTVESNLAEKAETKHNFCLDTFNQGVFGQVGSRSREQTTIVDSKYFQNPMGQDDY